jgi:hypothetical protein
LELGEDLFAQVVIEALVAQSILPLKPLDAARPFAPVDAELLP